jgi:hypothetical protein
MKSFNDYRPISFKFLGMTRHERLPRSTMFQGFHLLKLRLKSLLGHPITYFDIRASLTPEQQKNGDMWFLTAVANERARDAENCSRIHVLRCWMIIFRYLPELSYVQSVLGSPESPHHPDQPIVDNYLLRWGYKLHVPPSFVELIHGTDGDSAVYATESLM